MDSNDKPKGPHRFQPGVSGNPKGRPPGVVGKSVKEMREFWQIFLDKNSDTMQELLERIALEDPAKAFDLYLKAQQFIMPKLTEDLSASGPAVFVLPAGVETNKEETEDTEHEDLEDEC